ncbi:auxin-responsive protein IAA2-like [Vicia villosa]|uniref:auxin-responsive protein IAA2-like n=1 Tax=Vicia villosa TaxID=3911 RepID=UPI00273CE2EB|nr:auxin-responsive protein IAA2-like [Vicia villosa]
MWQRSMELELRLGPPGEEECVNEKSMKSVKKERYEDGDEESLLTLGNFSKKDSTCDLSNAKGSSFLQLSSMQGVEKDASQSQPCCTNLHDKEKKAFSPFTKKSDFPNRSQKRNSTSTAVGWPPIRSFRKNIASGSSSKSPTEPRHVIQDKVAASNKPIRDSSKGLFVKINMDGVPIGRKVDINAYDTYEKLSSAVDELFKSLIEEINLSHILYSQSCSAQRDSCDDGIDNKQEEENKAMMKGSLIESGEYSLVYEDNEGDKMLVGDVPWQMFVSTVKRLRVFKSSNLPAFNIGSKKDLD